MGDVRLVPVSRLGSDFIPDEFLGDTARIRSPGASVRHSGI